MYSFLEEFDEISVDEIKDEQDNWQTEDNEVVNRYCVNDAGELTHLLVRGRAELSFLTELASADSLIELTLQKCGLSEVPSIISQMTQLVVVDLDGNKITGLPSSIGQLTVLQHLCLNGNEFTQFDEKFCALKHLVQLELGGNQLTVLSTGIAALSQLQKLQLWHNKLTAIPAEIGDLSQLKEINLDNNQLTTLPAEVGQLRLLATLNLDGNKLTTLPVEIGKLSQLKTLNLNNNQLTTLPAEIGNLSQLQQLNLDHNQLTTVPAEIGKLSQLQKLLLINNQLQTLPAEIGKLSQLKTLNLDNNQLTTLPVAISKLGQLQRLDLDNNQLIALPIEVGKMNKLQTLYLNHNRLTELPKTLKKMDLLAIFAIFDNPITNNIHEIAYYMPPKELIAYLLEVQKPETRTLNEAKVLVVGDERVGKTSIINRIIGREMDEQEKSTMGIDIQRHSLGNGININIWDFAGQQITHQTHQFFLSSRSLYLYILDAQKEDNDSGITQWLNTISATADKSPIIVVVNKCDLNPSYRFDTHRYQQDFNIVKVLYTSAQDEAKIKAEILPQISDSIDCLVKVVTEQIGQIKEVKMPFPPSWLAVKKELEDEQRKETDFIESAIYEHICKTHGLINGRLQDALLSVLNQIGTIVTYKDHQRLSVMQIINPAWVTNGVYKILRSNEINKSNATLNQQQFERIFANEPKYQQTRHYTWLIDLLKQFRLAFSIDEQTVLIPSRLESAQPAIDMTDYRQGLHFVFEYDGILKKNILHQFIVLMHEYITTAEDKYWQRGVFLQHNGASAVVISNEEKKTITIAIKQANPAGKELLTIIRHCIRRINGPDLVVDEQVPLLVENELYGYQSYDAILDAEQEGEKTIRCRVIKGGKKFRTFDIIELLGGYRIKDDTRFEYNKLDDDLFDICALETENRHAIFDEKEDLTNDRIKTALLNRKYKVSDQSRGGESGTGLSAGERDLVIRNDQTGVVECVIEAFVLKNHSTAVITEHLDKLVNHYDTTGNTNNYAISYVKSDRFYELWQKYQELIPNFTDNSNDKGKNFVLTGKSTHGSGKFRNTVTHLFVNFYPGEQRE